ncbi:hypothetical protein ACS0TY_026520 [Phlomoides rotata]
MVSKTRDLSRSPAEATTKCTGPFETPELKFHSAVAAEILKIGYEESPEHAGCVIFNLALNDENEITIDILGALQMLLHELRSGT